MMAFRKDDPSFSAFRYLVADKASLYRRIMRVFVEAKQRYELHLRPREVREALASEAGEGMVLPEDVEGELIQLCEWGNLERHADTAEVRTVEEFNRARFLYGITPTGVAADEAVEIFQRNLRRKGKLDTAALRDIRDHLKELETLVASEDVDEVKSRQAMRALTSSFDDLTSEAQRFLGGLQRTMELQTLELGHFIAYKTQLIDYLQNFIHELVTATADIAETIHRIESRDVDAILQATARSEIETEFNAEDEDLSAAIERWRERWKGLRSWFISDAGRMSQAVELRARARSAIPAFLNAVAGVHERRMTRSDRVSDLRTLARWFAQAPSDDDAHRLWRAAFGLSPSRHLRIDPQTVDERADHPIPAQKSWLEAPPLKLSPRLRRTGRHTRRGPPGAVIDRSREKAALAQLAREEAEQILAARQRLITDGRIRLSQLHRLDRMEFVLFLDLLGNALARARAANAAVHTTSTDGTVKIMLEPMPNGALATIHTSLGIITGKDCFVTISDALSSIGGRLEEPAEAASG